MKTVLGSIFHNKNGLNYEVLQVLDFNDVDKEYYKNSWQKYRVALLQVPFRKSYVVAEYLGEEDWGSGYYTEDIDKAIEKYNSIATNYFKV